MLGYIFSHMKHMPLSTLTKLSFKSHSIVHYKPQIVVECVFWGCWTMLHNIFWCILLLLFIVGVVCQEEDL